MKKHFKEVIIFVLLAIVIIFLLIILLYEYSPKSKSLSVVDTYKRTDDTSNVLKEISSSSLVGDEQESIITSYSVSSLDLSSYAKDKTYNQGRSNPFATVNTETSFSPSNNNNNNNGKNSTKNTSNPKTNSNSSVSTDESTGYFKSTGTNK